MQRGRFRVRFAAIATAVFCLFSAPASRGARQQPNQQTNQQSGEVRFSADNEQERDSGVWIDGKYSGYVKELKGNKKVLLPPGEHEISIRQAGYKDFTKKLVVEPDQIQTVNVVMEENTKAIYPGTD